MSSRYTHNKSFAKTQKKFVPKTATPDSIPRDSQSTQTLSNSLRQSLARESDAAGATSSASVPKRPGNRGNFVNYLPQDEAVAAGRGADEGGLDPVEAQGVVDYLNGELSRLLKLSPRDFWREG